MVMNRNLCSIFIFILSVKSIKTASKVERNKIEKINCHWTYRDTPKDSQVVHSVTQKCMQGSLIWLNPFGGIEATFYLPTNPPFDPLNPNNEERVFCYMIEQSHTEVKVDREVYKDNDPSFSTLLTEDCIEDTSVKMYAESVPNTISSIIGEFKLRYVWRTRSPFEKCRKCSPQEINFSFCSLQFVSKGRLSRKSTPSFNFRVTEVIRSTPDVIKQIQQSQSRVINSTYVPYTDLTPPRLTRSNQHHLRKPNIYHLNHLHHHPSSHHLRSNSHAHFMNVKNHFLHNPHKNITQHRQQKLLRHRHKMLKKEDSGADSYSTNNLHPRMKTPQKQQRHSSLNSPILLKLNNEKCEINKVFKEKINDDNKNIYNNNFPYSNYSPKKHKTSLYGQVVGKHLRHSDDNTAQNNHKYILIGDFILEKLNVVCLLSEQEFETSWDLLEHSNQNMCLYNSHKPS